MATTTTAAHPEVAEELHRLHRALTAAHVQIGLLMQWTHLDLGASEDYTKSYMVRTHHPSSMSVDDVKAELAGAPHAHEALRVMYENGEVTAEHHYTHAAHAAAVRAHFDANGVPTSHHFMHR